MRRILAYRTLGLGDLLTSVPALRALRRHFPGDELVLATTPALTPLAALVGGVDRVAGTPELAVPRLDGPPPDWAVNLHGAGPQSHRALAALRPGRLVAFGCARAGVTGPRWRADEHEVVRWCRLLAAEGIAADPGDLALARPASPPPRRGVTVLHPGAAAPERRWPAPRFSAVASALRRAGHEVVVTGVAAEAPLAREITRRAGLLSPSQLAGRLGIVEMAALVADARLVICGDTGVGHLATAYGTPSLLLFGPMSPRLWGPPPGRSQHRVIWPEAVRDPAPEDGADDVDPRLLAITVEEVLAEAEALLAA